LRAKIFLLPAALILGLTLCGAAAGANISYGNVNFNSSIFEIILTAIAFIGIGAACSKSSGSRHGIDFDNDDSDWDDGGFDGGDGGD
jgi:hypothetical protein